VTFEAPTLLLGLFLVPLAILAYLFAQRRRLRYAARFTNLDLLASVAPRRPGWRRHLPAALTLLALTALLVALARPHATIAVPRERATVMLATDASASMRATDVRPSRLDAAKGSARAFVADLPPKLRLGLVSFDQNASLLAPPTVDRAPVRGAIDTLRPGGGTATGDALRVALRSIRRDAAGEREPVPAAIVLLSDGKTTAGEDPLAVARDARRARVPIYAVALGTDEGTIALRAAGSSFDQTVAVPPDRATLRAIARQSGGRYFDAPSAEGLRTVYESLGSRLGKERERTEVTAAFAGGGVILLLVGGGLSLLWFGRLP
jgi:Ca-activated chloride channel family protein